MGTPYLEKIQLKRSKTLGSSFFFTPAFNHLYFLALPMWLPVELEQIKLIFHKILQK